ncbi:MAG: hypothetical protein ACRC80_05065 [Waterburya sp.]
MQLQRYKNDGLELIIDLETGESFTSINGYSRLSGKAKSTTSARIKASSETLFRSSEIDTGYGVKVVRLIPEDMIVEWIPLDNPEIATKLMKMGVRAFLHQLAGIA